VASLFVAAPSGVKALASLIPLLAMSLFGCRGECYQRRAAAPVPGLFLFHCSFCCDGERELIPGTPCDIPGNLLIKSLANLFSKNFIVELKT